MLSRVLRLPIWFGVRLCDFLDFDCDLVGLHFDSHDVVGNEPLIGNFVRGFDVLADRLKDECFDLGRRNPADISGSISPSVEEC